MFDFNHPEENVTKLRMTGFDIKNFTPHGLSLWTDPGTGDVLHPCFIYLGVGGVTPCFIYLGVGEVICQTLVQVMALVCFIFLEVGGEGINLTPNGFGSVIDPNMPIPLCTVQGKGLLGKIMWNQSLFGPFQPWRGNCTLTRNKHVLHSIWKLSTLFFYCKIMYT